MLIFLLYTHCARTINRSNENLCFAISTLDSAAQLTTMGDWPQQNIGLTSARKGWPKVGPRDMAIGPRL